EAAGDVRQDPRLVDAVADSRLVERRIADRRRPVAQRVAERTTEGLPRFCGLERRRRTGRGAADVGKPLVVVRIPEIGAVAGTEVHIDLADADGLPLAG